MILVFFAEGFEEMEGVAPLDILRRAGAEVCSVGVGGKRVTGSHGITIECDMTDAEVETDSLEGVVLPGGMPGTVNLEKSPVVRACIDYAFRNGLWLCAICAAPSILGHMKLLRGKRCTVFPGMESELGEDAIFVDERVVRDGKLITGMGPGAAIQFGVEIVRAVLGEEAVHTIGGVLP